MSTAENLAMCGEAENSSLRPYLFFIIMSRDTNLTRLQIQDLTRLHILLI